MNFWHSFKPSTEKERKKKTIPCIVIQILLTFFSYTPPLRQSLLYTPPYWIRRLFRCLHSHIWRNLCQYYENNASRWSGTSKHSWFIPGITRFSHFSFSKTVSFRGCSFVPKIPNVVEDVEESACLPGLGYPGRCAGASSAQNTQVPRPSQSGSRPPDGGHSL